MKKFIVFCLAAMMAAPIFAQEVNPPALPETAPEAAPDEIVHAPKIVCDQTTFEFGDRENTETIEHTFIIKNEGDLSLEISNVRAACGCTVANISTKLVAPGEQAQLTARLSLRGRNGRQRKAITVSSNDPQTPNLTLFLDGNAVAGIEAVPNRLFYGQIAPDVVQEQCAEVKAGTTPFKIIAVESDTPKISTRMEVLEDGKNYRICASTVPPLDIGELRANVTVRTDNQKIPVISLPISASVIGGIAVAPRELSIPATGTEPVSRFVVLRPSTVQEFEVKEVVVPDPAIRSEVVKMPTGYRIQLSNIMPGIALVDQKVIVRTSAEGFENIEIPIRVNP
ncbi:MAG: DUF1573 domain-containing protein [Kiritimatiellia bacterium]